MIICIKKDIDIAQSDKKCMIGTIVLHRFPATLTGSISRLLKESCMENEESLSSLKNLGTASINILHAVGIKNIKAIIATKIKFSIIS